VVWGSKADLFFYLVLAIGRHAPARSVVRDFETNGSLIQRRLWPSLLLSCCGFAVKQAPPLNDDALPPNALDFR
jgi:hypothetical protein